MSDTKVCSTCRVDKALTDFHVSKKGKHGRASQCKECKNKEAGDRNKVLKNTKKPKILTKTCSTCGVTKPISGFSKSTSNVDGYRGQCKVCVKATTQIYQDSNRELINAKAVDWTRNNKEKRREINTQWKKRNKGSVNSLAAKRRAQKLQATPVWADHGAIKALYTDAQRVQDLLGIEMHIDHIIPLQGALVCGLHVESNLQILPAKLNLRKSNKFKVQ